MECRARILVVEDDEHLLFALVEALTDAGYEVRPAADGHLAIQRLATFTPDVILLDLMMPFMDGFEVLGWLRRNRAAVPVVVASDADDYDAGVLGAAAKLSKPFTVEQLLEAIERVHKPR